MRSSVLSLPFLAALILLLQVQPDEATIALTIGTTALTASQVVCDAPRAACIQPAARPADRSSSRQ